MCPPRDGLLPLCTSRPHACSAERAQFTASCTHHVQGCYYSAATGKDFCYTIKYKTDMWQVRARVVARGHDGGRLNQQCCTAYAAAVATTAGNGACMSVRLETEQPCIRTFSCLHTTPRPGSQPLTVCCRWPWQAAHVPLRCCWLLEPAADLRPASYSQLLHPLPCRTVGGRRWKQLPNWDVRCRIIHIHVRSHDMPACCGQDGPAAAVPEVACGARVLCCRTAWGAMGFTRCGSWCNRRATVRAVGCSTGHCCCRPHDN